MNWLNFAVTNGQQAPTGRPTVSDRHAVRSLPVHTASSTRNWNAGTIVNHSSSAPRMVIRILVGVLKSRVRRNPMKPVVFTGAGRSGTILRRTKNGAFIAAYSGQAAIRTNS